MKCIAKPALWATVLIGAVALPVQAQTPATPAASAAANPAAPGASASYGKNAAVGRRYTVNGIGLYVETYGSGTPMLQIHGNGESIAALGAQIEAFSKTHRVIVADSRGHGQSDLGPGRLTYEQMADDLAALLDQLKLKQVNVLGWSDGGIIGLMMALHHPDKVGQLAIMGANLEPEGAYPWALQGVARLRERYMSKLERGDRSRNWTLELQRLDLLGLQPHIPVADLARIQVPVLVMAGDRDVIRDDHTLRIFHALPKAQLAIFPGATHMIPQEDPERFNRTVRDFFSQPFRMPDTKDLGWFD